MITFSDGTFYICVWCECVQSGFTPRSIDPAAVMGIYGLQLAQLLFIIYYYYTWVDSLIYDLFYLRSVDL